MASAKMTLIGFYKWMQLNNDDLFQNLTVPSGVDKNKLINTILMNGAEFEVLYGDADFFKFLIGPWSDKWFRTMDRWSKALAIDYEPLENYDRKEEWEDNNNTLRADSRNHTSNTLNQANSTSSGTGSTENKKSAYDSNTYQPFDKSETGSSGSNSTNGLEAATGRENGNELEASNNRRTGRAHGNIGVTTSQQMLQSEIDISKFNLYDEIAALFLTEFCIYTY